MHRLLAVLALALLLPTPAVSAAEAPALPDAARDAFLALKTKALTGEAGAGQPGDPVAHAEAHVFNASRTDVRDARAAWRAAANATTGEGGTAGDAREAVLEAEAALLALAAKNVEAARMAGDHDDAWAWLQVALDRVAWEARGVPAEGLQPPYCAANATCAAPGEEAWRETLHSVLAIRAREEAVQAAMLQYAGKPAEARASARGAVAFTGLLTGDAADRLQPNLRAIFLENATRVPHHITELPEARKEAFLSAVVAPLTALEFNRDIEPLDEYGARNADAAFAAVRAAREDPALLDALAEEALTQYGADRGALFIHGEGTVDGLDAAEQALYDAALSTDADAVAMEARNVYTELRRVALLERGVVLKVETGGVQPDRVHEYRVTLVRPPLEGIGSYEIVLAYDPAVVHIADVEPLVLGENFTITPGAGRIVFGGHDATPLRDSARLAKLHMEATGPPEATTALHVVEATFLEPDGDAATIFRLRDGSATVANITVGDETPGDGDKAILDDGENATPTPPVVLLVALALACILGRRRT